MTFYFVGICKHKIYIWLESKLMINKEKIYELREKGLTYQAIGDELGCSKQYVEIILNPKRHKERNKKSEVKRRAYISNYYRIYMRFHKEYYLKHKNATKEEVSKAWSKYYKTLSK